MIFGLRGFKFRGSIGWSNEVLHFQLTVWGRGARYPYYNRCQDLMLALPCNQLLHGALNPKPQTLNPKALKPF